MYKDDDLTAMAEQLKKTIVLMIVILATFIIISVVIAKFLSNKVGMVVMIFGVCLEVFILGVYTTPILAYYRYIRDLTIGRTRGIKGIVKSVRDRPVYKDNKLFFYEIIIEEDGIERVLLLDEQISWPKISPNKEYMFQVHESFIMSLNPVT